MPRLAILHTHPSTIEPLKAIAAELMPGVEVVNVVDDSILAELLRNGGVTEPIAERLMGYARFAADAGADVILNACSSVGELVPREQAAVTVPVVRIDDAMAEAAVQRGDRVGVVATIATTLNPTTRLLRAKAAALHKDITITPALVTEAFTRLAAGDRDGHDALLLAAIRQLAAQVDVVVLAQVSMARVLPQLTEAERAKVFTSPRLGLEAVRATLAAHAEAAA
jgi:aspartate/glutamate racemase